MLAADQQAQLVAPQHPAEDGPGGAEDVRRLFLSELEQRPTDVELRVRLLEHLLHHNQLTDAYNHVADIESKDLPIFRDQVSWYETVYAILVRYQNENSNNSKLNWEFWMLIVSVLDKLVTFFLDGNIPTNKNLSDCVKAVFYLDQTLSIAGENINNSCSEKQFSQEFFIHYRAQLCFHLATLLFQQAKKDKLKYIEAEKYAIPLLLNAYHSAPVELKCVWLEHSSENCRKKISFWHRLGAFRCSQAGHILLGLFRDRTSSFPDSVNQLMTGQWREKTLKQIFITSDQQLKLSTSYFLTCPQLEDVPARLPDTSELLRYDEIAQLVHPDNLHYMVWIGLNTDPVNFHCSVFDGLQFTAQNIPLCSAESLCVLDIQAFLYCCIFCAQSNIEESKHLILYNSEKPAIIPACITDPYSSLNQTKWYASVYKMFKNESDSTLNDEPFTLIKGIEIVRCEGSHGLDPKLLVLLAQTFAKRAKKATKQSEIEALESRSDIYWRAVLPMLERLRNNQIPPQPQKRWFEYHGKEMTPAEINLYIEEGNLFSAQQLMKKKEHESALKLLSTLKDPYASFYQARTYKLLAAEQMSHNKESLTSEMRSENIILLSKARDCLYLTLDRLREPSVDKSHPLNVELGTEIKVIERMLSRIDLDNCHNRNECDAMSDEKISSVGNVGEPAGNSMMHSTYHNGTHNMNSTPHNVTMCEARPFLESLDAQFRQMSAAKDGAVAFILDQNRIFLEEIRGFKVAVTGLTTSVNELLKEIKKYPNFPQIKNLPPQKVERSSQTANNLGGFFVTSTPTFKQKTDDKIVAPSTPIETIKPNPIDCSFGNIFGGKPQPQTSTESTSPSSFCFGSLPSSKFNLAATSIFTSNKPAVFGSPKLEFGSGCGDDSGVAEQEEEYERNLDEDIVLYCQRAKLFRFTNGEWKERGTGDVKIIKHPSTSKIRVLMRCEQLHKICLLHTLSKGIEYKPKDDHTWLFAAPDYYDGGTTIQQFCLSFKNLEIATQFMDAVNKARNETTGAKLESESNPDLEIVNKLTVPPDLQEKALKLQLPKNLYATEPEPSTAVFGCTTSTNSTIIEGPFPYIFTTSNTTSFGTPKLTTSSAFGFGSFFSSQSSTSTQQTSKPFSSFGAKQENNIFGGTPKPETANNFLCPAITEPSSNRLGSVNFSCIGAQTTPAFGSIASQKQESVLKCQTFVKQETTMKSFGSLGSFGTNNNENITTMFCECCTLSYKVDERSEWIILGKGVIKMLYDSNLHSGKIDVTDDTGVKLSTTTILEMKLEDTSCIWTGLEHKLAGLASRVLKAQFSSPAAAQEMYRRMEQIRTISGYHNNRVHF